MASETRFAVVRKMLEAKGYRLVRINGSHHIFEKPGCTHQSVPVHHGKVRDRHVRKIEKL